MRTVLTVATILAATTVAHAGPKPSRTTKPKLTAVKRNPVEPALAPGAVVVPSVTLPAYDEPPATCEEGQMALRRPKPGRPAVVLVCVPETVNSQGKCLDMQQVTRVSCVKSEAACMGRTLGPVVSPLGCGFNASVGASPVWCQTSAPECVAYEDAAVIKSRWLVVNLAPM